MKCNGCGVSVESDGHGELVHVIPIAGVDAFRYGCKTGKVPASSEYPVAN